jgi:hypothetical protein
MNDLHRAALALLQLENPFAATVRALLNEIVAKNQNPNSGGDRQMSEADWVTLREAQDALYRLSCATSALLSPSPSSAWMGDEPVPSIPRVVNATAEGNRVFALIDDDTILKSGPLDDENCAELHADQVVRLGLSANFLTQTLKWVESES